MWAYWAHLDKVLRPHPNFLLTQRRALFGRTTFSIAFDFQQVQIPFFKEKKLWKSPLDIFLLASIEKGILAQAVSQATLLELRCVLINISHSLISKFVIDFSKFTFGFDYLVIDSANTNVIIIWVFVILTCLYIKHLIWGPRK